MTVMEKLITQPMMVVADLNPDSLEVLTGCMAEPALADVAEGVAVQFERQGYFCPDPDSAPGALVFNRTVGLRDTWAKESGRNAPPAVGRVRF